MDFRQLNSLTKDDTHPLLWVDDTLDSLSVAQCFSTIDLASGYWQVEVAVAEKIKRKQHSLPHLVCFSSAQCLLGYAMHPVPSKA